MALHRLSIGASQRRFAVTSAGLIALCVLGLGAWHWWARRPDRYLEEAERLVRAGQPASAAQWLELPKVTARTSERAWLLSARIALARGRPADAVAPLNRVRSSGPLGAEAAYWKGRVLLAVGNLPYALAWFQQALRRRPDDPECLRWLAAAAYDLGDLDKVLKTLQTLTRLRPGDAPAWRTLGLVYLELPESGEEEMAASSTAYETSLRLDPNQPQVRLELASVLIRRGRFDEAQRQLEACQGKVPEVEWTHLLAQVAWNRGEREHVKALLDAALARAPNHPGLLSQRGLLAQAEGQLDDAVAWFGRAVAVNAYDSQLFYRRSLALRALGRSDEADQDSKQAADLKHAVISMSALNAEATDHPLDPDVRCRLGRLCERLGKPALAASWYRAALACDPRSQEARSALAALPPQ